MAFFKAAVFIATTAFSVSCVNSYDLGGGLDIANGIGDGLDAGVMPGISSGYANTPLGLGGIGSSIGSLNGYGDLHDAHYEAAIQSKRLVSVVPVQEKYEEPKVHSISVEPAEMPLILNLKSKSSPLIVNAMHIGEAKGSIKKTKSVDAPHIRVHETLKPVLQEVREVVQPQRKILQFISPVVQRINTFVTGNNGYAGGGYGGGSYGGANAGGYGGGDHGMSYFDAGQISGGYDGEGMIGGDGGGIGFEGGYNTGKIGGLADGGYDKANEMFSSYSRSIKKIANVGRKGLPVTKISIKRGKF